MNRRVTLLLLLSILLVLAACQDQQVPTSVPAADPPTLASQPGDGTGAVAPTIAPPTPIVATPTPSEPLAASVNGQPIFLADYEKELSRYEQAQNQLGIAADQLPADYRTIVLDALIETELIAQAAEANGIAITPDMVAARLAELQELSGGEENFAAWLETNQMTLEEFNTALTAEMVTEKMVEFVTADVPTTAEQVHARYLQVDDPALAQSLLDQARGGLDFAALAQQYSLDRVTGENGGDLGFFARGSLLVPVIEEAAFNLQPGEISEVIQGNRADGSGTTYYLVNVIERDPQRSLSADLLYAKLQQRFEEWLAQQWAQAEIIRYIDPAA